MVRRREEYPVEGELVVGKVETINPNSVFIRLDEYDKLGMIHISEIAKKWVRDVRKWVRVGQIVVCEVLHADHESIALSLKRVSPERKSRRMLRWKRDKKGEKFLLEVAKRQKVSPEQMYDEVGYIIQENFRDMLHAFELALDGADVLKKKGIPSKWAIAIATFARKKLKKKVTVLRGVLHLRSTAPDGIGEIRRFLKQIQAHGIEVSYVSAPKYAINLSTENPKKSEKDVMTIIEGLRKKFSGECEFKWRK